MPRGCRSPGKGLSLGKACRAEAPCSQRATPWHLLQHSGKPELSLEEQHRGPGGILGEAALLLRPGRDKGHGVPGQTGPQLNEEGYGSWCPQVALSQSRLF